MAAAVTAEETILHMLNDSIYNHKNIIGTGSYGTVYLITYGDKKLAVKVAKTKPTSGYQVVDPGNRYNVVPTEQPSEILLQREASILKRLGEQCNPYIVCFKYKISPSIIATEFLENYQELNDVAVGVRNKTVTLPELCNIIKELILGLQHMHHNGIAHSDIHFSNIMVNVEEIKIRYIDFGLACSKNAEIDECTAGCVAYRDPMLPPGTRIMTIEQAQKADIWALGVVICVLTLYTCPPTDAFKYTNELFPQFVEACGDGEDKITWMNQVIGNVHFMGYAAQFFKIDLAKLIAPTPSARDLNAAIIVHRQFQ